MQLSLKHSRKKMKGLNDYIFIQKECFSGEWYLFWGERYFNDKKKQPLSQG
jgi:hypothetical protein